MGSGQDPLREGAMDGAISALEAPPAYSMKSPPKRFGDDEARGMVEQFIAG